MHIFLIAGEPSGDLIGARLMAALKRQLGNDVRFSGIGGPQMAEQGLKSLFDYAALAVMGVFEVLPRVRSLLRLMGVAARAVEDSKPDILVTIDSPGFNFRVAKRLKGTGIPVVHYVAPTVWAWRPWRAGGNEGVDVHLVIAAPFAKSGDTHPFAQHRLPGGVAAPSEGLAAHSYQGVIGDVKGDLLIVTAVQRHKIVANGRDPA